MRARRVNVQNDIASEVQHKLLVSRQLLRQQIKLLQTILWWYLLPFFVGVILFYFASVTSTLSKVIYIVIVAAVYGYIYYLNRRAVERHLKPLEESLTKTLNDLSGSEPGSNDKQIEHS
jgi:Flp pilus assembly protein TadB